MTDNYKLSLLQREENSEEFFIVETKILNRDKYTRDLLKKLKRSIYPELVLDNVSIASFGYNFNNKSETDIVEYDFESKFMIERKKFAVYMQVHDKSVVTSIG